MSSVAHSPHARRSHWHRKAVALLAAAILAVALAVTLPLMLDGSAGESGGTAPAKGLDYDGARPGSESVPPSDREHPIPPANRYGRP